MLTSLLGIIMKFFYEVFHNYGIAIIAFTLFSKIILFPVSVIVQKNSIKLVSLKPKINRIKIDYFGDEYKVAELENQLYKEEKYNPFLSVVPLILQVIILICLITIVNNPITYITNVDKATRDSLVEKVEDARYKELEVIKEVKEGNLNNKELKELDLTFINSDLTLVSKDIHNYWFPILAALSALIYCLVEVKKNVLQREQSLIYNISTVSFTILLALFLGLYVPRGVALYWIFSNIFALIQLLLLNKIINPEKYVDYAELEITNKELSKLTLDTRTKNIIKREKEDYKRFFSIENKHLVVYSEDASYYNFMKGIVEYILKHTNITIHYVTSDYNDENLKKNSTHFKTYYIGEKRLISLMMKMDSDVVLMTMPDLNTFHIKRSYYRKDIEYIFVNHGIDSIYLSMREGSLDHYDTIFVCGKYQEKEIRKGNKLYHLKRKIVKLGYPILDDMLASYKGESDGTILIAPSWQKDNIMETCIEELINVLSEKHKLIVRAHPYFIKHNKQRLLELKKLYKNNKNVKIEDDYLTISKMFKSSLLITDWSGIAYEYSFTTKRPTLYINTPMKIVNENYKEIETNPYTVWSREKLGKSVELEDINKIEKTVNELLKSEKKYSKQISDFLEDSIYNIGNSSEVAGKYIISTILKKIERRKND